MKDLTRIIEALLFCADAPLKTDQILEVLPEAAPEEVAAAIAELQTYYQQNRRGVALFAVAGGHQLLTRPDVAAWVEKFLVGRRRQRLSRAALEVLAIVAYRQPATRGEIEAIRGVDCGAVLRTLLDRRLITVKGRAKRVGNPLLYATTDRFMEHFGIMDLSELPKLAEFRALLDRDEAQEELRQQGVLPVETTGAERPSVGGAEDSEITGDADAEPETGGGGCAETDPGSAPEADEKPQIEPEPAVAAEPLRDSPAPAVREPLCGGSAGGADP